MGKIKYFRNVLHTAKFDSLHVNNQNSSILHAEIKYH